MLQQLILMVIKIIKKQKSSDNLLKLGITMVQLGEKDQELQDDFRTKKEYQKQASLCYKKLNMSKKIQV